MPCCHKDLRLLRHMNLYLSACIHHELILAIGLNLYYVDLAIMNVRHYKASEG